MPIVVKKLLQLVVVLLVVSFLTFFMINLLPGTPDKVIIPFGTDEQRALLREDLGLDDPLLSQYGRWLGNFATGDMGNYYTVSSKRPVSDRISSAMPVSLQLMVYAQVIALLVAIPLGVFTAYRSGSRFDKIANSTAFGLVSLPNFALALVLAYWVGVKAGWVPPQGYTRISEDPADHFKRMVLPTVSLAVGQIAIYMRLLRSDMIATLQEDFILMAKAKGVSNRRVLWRHALRPSSLTLLTVAGLNVGTLIGGAVVIEQVFQLPGMGYLIAEAILSRQYVALQSAVAIIAIGYVMINVLIDVLYNILDPRIRNVRSAT